MKFCAECAPLEHEAAQARKAAKRRTSRKPCRGCKRVKQPNAGHSPYCLTCQKARSAPKQCQRGCGRPVRAKMAKLCEPCAAQAVKDQTMRRRRWEKRTGYVRPKTPVKRTQQRREGARMSYRLLRERDGAEVGMAAPIVVKGKRVDSEMFPTLDSGPMVAALERAFQKTQNAWAPKLTGPKGKPLPMPGRKELYFALGTSERAVLRWRKDGERIEFDVADRILQRAGWNWFDVWEPCPGDQQHLQDVTLWGECSRCEAYCTAEDAFTSTETSADRVGGQLRLEAA